jgi:predicted amidophosphoribosyltransferase
MRGRRGVAVPLGRPVPAAEPGVCRLCHGPARDSRARCWCCRAVSRALGDDSGDHPTVPASLFMADDPLHTVLRGYKDAGAVAARRHFARRLAAHVDAFLEAHARCVEREAGPWDAVAVVPSSVRRAFVDGSGRSGRVWARHPLTAVIDDVGVLSGIHRVELVRGPGAVGHLAPQRHAFVAPETARRRRVLLLDDTWVTGARMASAAAALELAGATVVAQVVAGRLVRAPVPPSPGGGVGTSRGATAESAGTTAVPCCLWHCPDRRPSNS